MGNAIFQIVLMLLVAFIFGFIIAWLLFKNDKQESTAVIDNNSNIQIKKLNLDLNKSKSEVNLLTDELNICKAKTLKTQAELNNSKSESFSTPSVSQSPIISKDDLKIVEGIGPKIEELLNKAEIYTFKQLSNSNFDTLKQILVNAGSRYQMHDPSTWSKQSQLAADGKWDELKDYQDQLNAGKV